MDTLRLKNYRCFEDTGIVKLKPLTFLVGANSSGKSSFLKFFPLLKQSLGVNRNGTFLWYSNDVDFKDFKNTVRNGEGDIEICFTYACDMSFQRRKREKKGENKELTEQNVKTKITVNLKISAKGKNAEDYLSFLRIQYFDQDVQIEISEDGNAKVKINNRDIATKFRLSLISYQIRLISRIYEGENDVLYSAEMKTAAQLIKEELGLDKDGKQEVLDTEWNYMQDKETCFNYLRTIKPQGDVSLLNDLYILLHLNDIIDNINFYLYNVSSNITYVRPLRVTTERYYRYQNYAVNEIDSDGKNLAMYLANLSKQQMERFREWTSKLFNFSIFAQTHEGHVELQIKEGEKGQRNLVDAGFGYTQLLPIVTMIWDSLRTYRPMFYEPMYDVPKFIVIEQPELHLHPRMQAKFGAMLAKVVESENKKNIKFIIETHSESILNSVGIQIEHEELDKDKVNVVLFNAAAEGYENYVEEAYYNERGFIDHWPTGFLSEDVY